MKAWSFVAWRAAMVVFLMFTSGCLSWVQRFDLPSQLFESGLRKKVMGSLVGNHLNRDEFVLIVDGTIYRVRVFVLQRHMEQFLDEQLYRSVYRELSLPTGSNLMVRGNTIYFER